LMMEWPTLGHFWKIDAKWLYHAHLRLSQARNRVFDGAAVSLSENAPTSHPLSPPDAVLVSDTGVTMFAGPQRALGLDQLWQLPCRAVWKDVVARGLAPAVGHRTPPGHAAASHSYLFARGNRATAATVRIRTERGATRRRRTCRLPMSGPTARGPTAPLSGALRRRPGPPPPTTLACGSPRMQRARPWRHTPCVYTRVHASICAGCLTTTPASRSQMHRGPPRCKARKKMHPGWTPPQRATCRSRTARAHGVVARKPARAGVRPRLLDPARHVVIAIPLYIDREHPGRDKLRACRLPRGHLVDASVCVTHRASAAVADFLLGFGTWPSSSASCAAVCWPTH
jgi:hypothetical protein